MTALKLRTGEKRFGLLRLGEGGSQLAAAGRPLGRMPRKELLVLV